MESSQKRLCLRTKTIFTIALAFFCTVVCFRGIFYAISKGFCIQRITQPISFDKDLSLPSPTKKQLSLLQEATNQPFLYLTKGSQAYAFVSKDGKYILKLFKLHHMNSIEYLKSFPLPSWCSSYRDSLVERRRYRIDLTINSYLLAHKFLQEECALLYTQILPSKKFTLPITLVDAAKRSYTIDLANVGFALQKKATLVLPTLEQFIKKNDLDSAKKAVSSLLFLIQSRSKKGILDVDPDLHKNAGFIGTEAIFIDIGSFQEHSQISKKDVMKVDVKKVFDKLLTWIEPRSPELHDHLKEQIESL